MTSRSGAQVAASLQTQLARRLGLKAAGASRDSRREDPSSAPLAREDSDGVLEGPLALSLVRAARCRSTPPAGEETLSALDWRVIESSLAQRRDAHCPICMEPFREREVLLSCSHMFHRACLRAFERAVRTPLRRCPVCRAGNYQKKITHEGSRSYAVACAVRLQALVRGWRARRLAGRLRRSRFLGGGGSPGFRRRFAAAELAAMTSAISGAAGATDIEAAAALSESDSALRLSREVEAEFALMLQRRSEAAAEVLTPMVSNETTKGGALSEERWAAVLGQCLARSCAECAICMVPLLEDTAMGLRRRSQLRRRRAVLLSCSHAFHDKCIGRLEELLICSALALDDLGIRDRCPVCRQGPYAKRLLALDCQHFIWP